MSEAIDFDRNMRERNWAFSVSPLITKAQNIGNTAFDLDRDLHKHNPSMAVSTHTLLRAIIEVGRDIGALAHEAAEAKREYRFTLMRLSDSGKWP